MSRILLSYDSAMAAGLDAGNRSMRVGNRTSWNEEDFEECVKRVDELAVAFYCANVYDNPKVPIEVARYHLAQTKGLGTVYGNYLPANAPAALHVCLEEAAAPLDKTPRSTFTETPAVSFKEDGE